MKKLIKAFIKLIYIYTYITYLKYMYTNFDKFLLILNI